LRLRFESPLTATLPAHPLQSNIGDLWMSVTIKAGTKQLTMFNIYEVRKAKQQKLIDLLDRAAKELAHKSSGLISFVIHRSFDGTRVVNYSQWVSREAFEA